MRPDGTIPTTDLVSPGLVRTNLCATGKNPGKMRVDESVGVCVVTMVGRKSRLKEDEATRFFIPFEDRRCPTTDADAKLSTS